MHPGSTAFDELVLFCETLGMVKCSGDEPTFSSSTSSSCIDHIFATDSIDSTVSLGPDILSDHIPLNFHCRLSRESGSRGGAKLDRSKRRREIDQEGLKLQLEGRRLEEADLDTWAKTLSDAIEANSRLVEKKDGKPWWSQLLTDLRRRALRLGVLSRTDHTLRSDYVVARSAYHAQCRGAKRAWLDNQLESVAEDFRHRGLSTLYPVFHRHGGGGLQAPLTKLLEHCRSIFQRLPSPKFLSFPTVEGQREEGIMAPITEEEVMSALRGMRSSAASFLGLSPVDLKNIASLIILPLTKIYNEVLNVGLFPSNWLESILFFLHKGGEKSRVDNYRSIAIENAFLKVFNTIIYRRLYRYAEVNSLLPIFQYGFRKSRSTISAATLLYELASNQIRMGKKLYCCFYDFRKAFDYVDRTILSQKLQIIGLPISFCRLIHKIFSELNFRIKVGDVVSTPFNSYNGVAQGDALSPLLFSLFISDLPNSLPHKGAQLGKLVVPYLLYADDLITISDTLDDLQLSVDAMFIYCDENNLVINDSKTKFMVFHKGRLPNSTDLFLHQTPIPRVSSFKYLGFTFSTQLSFSTHINEIVLKARARVALLFIQFKISTLPPETVVKIFHTYVTPMFLYGIHIWFFRCSSSSMKSLNAVFTSFLKRYLRIPKSFNTGVTHFLCSTMPLSMFLQNKIIQSYNALWFPPDLSGSVSYTHLTLPTKA